MNNVLLTRLSSSFLLFNSHLKYGSSVKELRIKYWLTLCTSRLERQGNFDEKDFLT